MAAYKAMTETPPLVARAEHMAFTQSCWPEVGRLLAALAATEVLTRPRMAVIVATRIG